MQVIAEGQEAFCSYLECIFVSCILKHCGSYQKIFQLNGSNVKMIAKLLQYLEYIDIHYLKSGD